jgi:hypothetical protein
MIKNAPANVVIFAIAHELSHILLDALRSSVARFEMAVDITAMMTGYAEYYESGKTYYEKSKGSHQMGNAFNDIFEDTYTSLEMFDTSLESLLFQNSTTKHEVGYLTREEVHYVVSRVQQLRK